MYISNRIAVVILIIIGVILYSPSFFGEFVWDDEDFVYDNVYVREFRIDTFFTENVSAGRGKPSNYFRPIQLLVYATIHLFFGFNPAAYHIVSVLFHVAAAIAVYIFFHTLTHRNVVAFLTAFAFLIHPVQTESVSYVSGLSDPLFVLFGMMSVVFFVTGMREMREIRGIREREQAGSSGISIYYPASIMLYGLALLSKESGLVFLPITLLAAWMTNRWKSLVLLLPNIVLTILYLGYHFTAFNIIDMKDVWGNNAYSESVVVRIATFVHNLKDYILLILLPKDLYMERDFTIQVQDSFFTPWTVLFVLINAMIIVYLFTRRRGNASFLSMLFCFVCFYLSFIPVSGIVLINGIFYEHFLYLPIVFFFGFWFLFGEKYLTKKSLCIIGLIGLIGFIRSIVRQIEWADPVRLYEQTLHFAPQSVRVLNNLGMTLAQQGDLDRAIVQYKKAIELDPTVPNMYHNLGNIYRDSGDTLQAEQYYRKAIDISPDFSFSYASLMTIYQATGQHDKLQEIISLYQLQFPNITGK